MTGVNINRANIERDQARIGRIWGDRIGERIQTAARERAPVDEGTLRTSIVYVLVPGPGGRMHVVIGSPLPYARYIHEGTGIYGPHGTPIVPTRLKSATGGPPHLKFKPSGAGLGVSLPPGMRGFVFAKSVKGIKPNPFMVDALADVMGQIERLR